MLRNRILERIVFEVSDVAKGPLVYNDTPIYSYVKLETTPQLCGPTQESCLE